MANLTKSQERHRKLKAESGGVQLLIDMVDALTKEVAIIKRKINNSKDDDWCVNDGSYYGDKLYKVKYYNGVTEVSYGSNLDWGTFETAVDREYSDYYDHDIESDEPFISTIKSDGYIEYYQLAEINLNKSIEKKLDTIINKITQK